MERMTATRRRKERRERMALRFARYNENHDEHGQFAEGGGGSGAGIVGATGTNGYKQLSGFPLKAGQIYGDPQTPAEATANWAASREEAQRMRGEIQASDEGSAAALSPDSQQILNGLNDAPASTNTLYRGLRLQSNADGFQEGDHFHLSATSFSADADRARSFAGFGTAEQTVVLHAEPGATAFPIDYEGLNLKAFANEEESIVRGDFIVTGVSVDPDPGGWPFTVVNVKAI